MTIVLVMLVTTGALGAVADPATPMSLDGIMGMSSRTLHFAVAITTAFANLVVNLMEFVAVLKNAVLVDGVLAEVRRIREERGLPVE